MAVSKPRKSFGEPGGTEYDGETFHQGCLRAELIEIASGHCFAHAAPIIDALLAEFIFSPRRGLGRRHS